MEILSQKKGEKKLKNCMKIMIYPNFQPVTYKISAKIFMAKIFLFVEGQIIIY